MLGKYPIIVNNSERFTEKTIKVINPYNGEYLADQCIADEKDIKEILENIGSAFNTARRMSISARKTAISRIISSLRDNAGKIAGIISLEAGKPISDSRIEVSRAINVLSHSLSICEHIKGEIIDLSSNPGGDSRTGYVHYVPVGPVFAITPFNFPLNLAVHKIAPAIALGCPVIHRPSSKTPVSGYLLAKIVSEAGLPDYFYNFIPSRKEDVDIILASREIKKFSFTGSAEIGWELKKKACRVKSTLELGGNASCIISENADINNAVKRCVKGAFSYSGQVCISIQLIHVHSRIYNEFLDRFIDEAKKLKCGDPLKEDTVIGPIIDKDSFSRIGEWVEEAEKKGARLSLKPSYTGNIITPFVIENTSRDMKVETEELFGPGVIIKPYKDINDVINIINSSKYGLQAGIFSDSMDETGHVFENIDIGGLIVNDIPTFRSDSMPYGGVKDSGSGREGIMYAAREMLETKLMVINRG